MTVTPFDELKKAIGKRQQKEVAVSMYEKWNQAHPNEKAFSMDTWESHLSRANRGDEKGISWFFSPQGRPRGETLFEVLDLSATQREAIHAEASKRLQEAAGQRIRFVVDVMSIVAPDGLQKFIQEQQPRSYMYSHESRSPSPSEAIQSLFVSIRKEIVEATSGGRVLLLVTPELLDYLPTSLSGHDRCELAKVADAAEALQRLKQEVEAGAIAITRDVDGLPAHAWVACWREQSTLHFEPRDWAMLSSDPDTPATHPLSEIKDILAREPGAQYWEVRIADERDALSVQVTRPRNGHFNRYDREDVAPAWSRKKPAVRRALLALMTDEAAAAAVPWVGRLKLAEKFGGTPVSTPQERALAQEILSRERIEQVARESGGSLTKLDEPERLNTSLDRARRRGNPATLLAGGHYHFINPDKPLPPDVKSSALVTVHEWPRQPSAYRRLLDATASWTELDWRADPQLEALILRLDPQRTEERALVHAAATLLHEGALQPKPDLEPVDAASALRATLEVGFVPATLRLRPTHEGQIRGKVGPLNGPCPVDWVFDRRDQLGATRNTPSWYLPSGEKKTTAEERWIEALERDEDSRHFTSGARPLDAEPLPVPDWAFLDEQLAFTLLALREGLRSRERMTITDGRFLVGVGGGVFARVKAWERRARREAAPALMFRGRVERDKLQVLDVLYPSTTGTGYWAPSELILEAAGFVVEVTFVTSGLHAAGSLKRAPEPPNDDD